MTCPALRMTPALLAAALTHQEQHGSRQQVSSAAALLTAASPSSSSSSGRLGGCWGLTKSRSVHFSISSHSIFWVGMVQASAAQSHTVRQDFTPVGGCTLHWALNATERPLYIFFWLFAFDCVSTDTSTHNWSRFSQLDDFVTRFCCFQVYLPVFL